MALPVHAEPIVGIDNFFFYGLEYPGKPHEFTLALRSKESAISAAEALEPLMEYRPNANLALPYASDLKLDIREGATILATLEVRSSGEHLAVVSDCRKQEDYHTVFPYYPFRSYIPPETITYMCDTALGAVEVRLICHGKASCWQ